MQGKSINGIMLALLLIGILTMGFEVQPVKAELWTWTVDDDAPADFYTIQEAINAASPGDTIYVYNGTYYENVVVNKSVLLFGENQADTIIDGGENGTVIDVRADNVVISSFIILNSSKEEGRFFGIAIYYRKNVTVVDSNIRNNTYGIYIHGSTEITARANMVSDNDGGIIINFSQNCTITENYVSNNSWGISLYGSRNCELEDNAMADNLYNLGVNGEGLQDFANNISTSNTVNDKTVYYLINQRDLNINPSTYPNLGFLALVNSVEIVIQDLNVTQNFSGVLLVNTNDSKISNVFATRNYGGIVVFLSSNITVETSAVLRNTEAGIYLGRSQNSKIVLNTIANNTWNGIELDHSTNITIIANIISNNKRGILLYLSHENFINRNNFVENTFQVWTHVSYDNVWDDGYPSRGNYWSDYTGNDIDGDGIGDTPYEIDLMNIDRYPLMNPYVPPLGDLNEDGAIDISDIAVAALAFGSYPDHPRWNSQADVNQDGKADIIDLAVIAKNFGQTYP